MLSWLQSKHTRNVAPHLLSLEALTHVLDTKTLPELEKALQSVNSLQIMFRIVEPETNFLCFSYQANTYLREIAPHKDFLNYFVRRKSVLFQVYIDNEIEAEKQKQLDKKVRREENDEDNDEENAEKEVGSSEQAIH